MNTRTFVIWTSGACYVLSAALLTPGLAILIGAGAYGLNENGNVSDALALVTLCSIAALALVFAGVFVTFIGWLLVEWLGALFILFISLMIASICATNLLIVYDGIGLLPELKVGTGATAVLLLVGILATWLYARSKRLGRWRTQRSASADATDSGEREKENWVRDWRW